MQFYTVEQASEHLEEVITQAIFNQEEAAIVSENGAVILVPQEEFDAMQETLRLLVNPRALKALLAGHARREEGGLSDLLPEAITNNFFIFMNEMVQLKLKNL